MTKNIFSNPEKDYTYKLIASYFDNPTTKKINKDDSKFSIYMAKFPCLLLNEQRYLVAVVPKDNFPPGHFERLDNLRWVSLQVRNLTEPHPDLPLHNYEQKQDDIYDKAITIESRSKQISVYVVEDLPLKISLLHTKGFEYEYPNEGTLVAALETFRTILQFY